MTRTTLLLLAVKLKQYLGQVRRSPRNIVSLLTVYFVWLSVIGLVSLMLRFTGILSGTGPQGFLGILSEVTVTAILAVGAFLGIKGGVTALPYELDYVLTSNVKPRVFLLADLLFQLCLLTLFIIPPTSLMLTTLTYPGHLAYLGRAVPLYLLAILMSIMLSHVLGVSRSILGERLVRLLGWGLLTLILTPLLLLALRIPPAYPLTLHPALLLSSAIEARGESLYWLTPYLAVLGLAYIRLSNISFYSSVSPLLFTVLMEPPSRLSKYIRLPAGLDSLLALGAARGYSSLMYRLHLVRVLREGSLWTGITVLLFLTLANTAVPRLIGVAQFPEVAELTMIALYIPLLPALLSINWSISERPNTWVVNLSTKGEKHYVPGLFLAYVTVTFPFSTLLYGLVSIGSAEMPFLLVDMVLLLAMSIFGSALSILVSLSARLSPSPLSLTSLLYILIPLTGSVLFSLPILVIRLYEPLASSPTPSLMVNMAAYVGVSAVALYKILVMGGAKYLK
ncbi:MAG: hypothetical protein RMJ28_06570 [Nitrososphaerota archaeon]|nr:hypothetical protein [Nitrososphaerota archaeon]